MNNQPIRVRNTIDENGKPAGGSVTGRGIRITWQDGPLGRGDDRVEPNGAFVETVIRAAFHRIEFYNQTGFECDENNTALAHLGAALEAIAARTARREAAGTEGTHAGT